MEYIFNKNEVFTQLIKSTHGDLNDYENIVSSIAKNDIEFLAHLTTWNLIKGEIRDSKIAIPVLTLRHLSKDDSDLAENAISNLMSLDPKNLIKAYNFNKQLSADKKIITGGFRKMLEDGLKKYILLREENIGWWIKTAIHHRKSLKALYAVSHVKPNSLAQKVLFEKKYPKNSIFEKIANLKNMSPQEAAGTILNFEIPAKIAIGALGIKVENFEKNQELVLALIEGMSGQQLINNHKLLESFGVFNSKVLTSEYNKALKNAEKDKNVSTLKAGRAIKAIKNSHPSDDHSDEIKKQIIEKLTNLQDAKIAQKGIDGDWAILADASGSMQNAIEAGIEISSYLTKSVKGNVYLIFFNIAPRCVNATGKSLEEIKDECKRIKAGGLTSCGCGISYLSEKNILTNGIILISDGGDNTNPLFGNAYIEYKNKKNIEPSVYFFKLKGDPDKVTKQCEILNIHINQTFNWSGKEDYYSLPNIIPTLKTSKWSLIDEIMNTPLLTFNDVFQIKSKKGK